MNIHRLNKTLFNTLNGVVHWLTETPTRNRVGRPLVRLLGGMTTAVKQAQRQASPQEAAEEWQRMFPSKKMVPITQSGGDLVIAEIRSECPYRGSGNVAGCHRMMEYDRKLMEAIGGSFVVLKSQAEPGVLTCQVAFGRAADQLPISALERVTSAPKK